MPGTVALAAHSPALDSSLAVARESAQTSLPRMQTADIAIIGYSKPMINLEDQDC